MKSHSPPSKTQANLLSILVTGIVHCLGISLIAIIVFIPFVTQDTLSLYFEALSNPTFASATRNDILLHLGLATCLWALGNILFRLWDLKRKENPKRIRATRGSVMVETLIVLVPFLLLTSGIAQLTILNMSGVLAHLASYQATRTVWVWQPEANKNRKGVNSDLVQRRARLAAAAIMAPVAPGDYLLNNDSTNRELEELRGAMTGAFTGNFNENSGSDGKNQASGFLAQGRSAEAKNLGFSTAFDSTNFPKRAARKLTFAYASTALDVSTSDSTITTNLKYKQNIVFPWFAYIWGSVDTVGGRPGYYVQLSAQFSMPAQVDL